MFSSIESPGFIDPFNEGERRRWHTHVFAVERPEQLDSTGAIVWMGDQAIRGRISSAPTWLRFHDVSIRYGVIFDQIKISRRDNKPLTHLVSIRDVGDTLSLRKGCGASWIGIAKFPLVRDWFVPSSSWIGWTHLLHTDDRKEAEATFDFVMNFIIREGYPSNPIQLTREIASFLRDKPRLIIPAKLSWKYPWLDKKLTHHPLTGERVRTA